MLPPESVFAFLMANIFGVRYSSGTGLARCMPDLSRWPRRSVFRPWARVDRVLWSKWLRMHIRDAWKACVVSIQLSVMRPRCRHDASPVGLIFLGCLFRSWLNTLNQIWNLSQPIFGTYYFDALWFCSEISKN